MTKKVESSVRLGNRLTEEQAQAIELFKREMAEKVIPEIRKIMEERNGLALESRQWQLKTLR
jgi:hypothetical protein